MTDNKKPRSAYTKLQISHPYLLLSDTQFALLDDSIDRNTIQYDHMLVQTTPILLFRCTDKNCYVNIIEHAKANITISTCVFSYYHNISVHTTLVTTNYFFFLLNIKEELQRTCGKYNHETTRTTYSVSIINCRDLCNCVLQTSEIQLIGSHSNSTSKGNFVVQYTFNLVTEWIHSKSTMSYYRENVHILRLPSQAKLPDLNIATTDTKNIYAESKTPIISLQKHDALVNRLKHDKLHLTKADQNGKDTRALNSTLTNNIQSSMIYLYIMHCFNYRINFPYLLIL